MGDLMRCKSSLERPSEGAVAAPETACGPSRDPGTMISGMAMARGPAMRTPAEGLRNRIRRSPLEYSNSSRLCSVMKRRSCSICSISGLANDGVDFEGFFCFMPVLEHDEIPRDAGQYFGTVGVHSDIILDANPPD